MKSCLTNQSNTALLLLLLLLQTQTTSTSVCGVRSAVLLQLLLLSLILLSLSTNSACVCAFTPDAAFKRSQYNLGNTNPPPSSSSSSSSYNNNGNSNTNYFPSNAGESKVFTYSKSEPDVDDMRRRRGIRVPFVAGINSKLRKSVSAPPSFEEYMMTRQRQLQVVVMEHEDEHDGKEKE